MSTPLNALTVDVEDWHQLAIRKLLGRATRASHGVLVNTHLIMDLLAEYDARATFFVVGSVAAEYPQLVRRMKAEGHEVGTHGFAHRLVGEMGPQEFEADLRRSIATLEDITQEPVWGHRAAEFSLDGASLWAFDIMASVGLRYDSSVFPIRHPRYGIPSAPRHPYVVRTRSGSLLEFPLATARLFGQNLPVAGGGYLRLFPLSFIRWGIHALNRNGQAAVLYVHPYEFEQSWLDLPVPTRSLRKWFYLRLRAVKRNWGRGQPMQVKLVTLLKSFSFSPLREVMLHGAEWQSSDIFSAPRAPVRPPLPVRRRN